MVITMNKRSAVLLLTNKCNASCAVCCGSCSPECDEIMPESMMTDIIKELEALGSFKEVEFTGGEPFLCPDLLIKGIRQARDSGFATRVATNGFWGEWSKEDIRHFFNCAKLDMLCFSTDTYHAQYVSDEALGRAVTIAKTSGIQTKINIGENKESPSARAYFNSMGNYKYETYLEIYPHVRAGRAVENLCGDSFYSFSASGDKDFQRHDMVSFRYDGEVFPCYSPYIFDSEQSLGNLRKTSIKHLLNNDRNGHRREPERNGN